MLYVLHEATIRRNRRRSMRAVPDFGRQGGSWLPDPSTSYADLGDKKVNPSDAHIYHQRQKQHRAGRHGRPDRGSGEADLLGQPGVKRLGLRYVPTIQDIKPSGPTGIIFCALPFKMTCSIFGRRSAHQLKTSKADGGMHLADAGHHVAEVDASYSNQFKIRDSAPRNESRLVVPQS